MPDFSTRSRQAELLDGEELDRDELFQNLKELDTINQLLGGHRATLLGLKKLIPSKPNTPISIADFGCGGGDTLRVVRKWGQRRNLDLRLTGFDLLPEAIEYANQHTPADYNIQFKQANFHDIPKSEPFDIVISSLFTHHLYDDDLNQVLQKKLTQSRLGFVVNDLHRHWLAYHSIKLLTRLLSKSSYVKNDAPLSVAKGFLKSEWQDLLQNINIPHFQIQWVWAFRHLIVVRK